MYNTRKYNEKVIINKIYIVNEERGFSVIILCQTKTAYGCKKRALPSKVESLL